MKRKGEAPFFEGWYWKQQSPEQTLALIVAHHAAKNAPETATLQVLTEKSSLVLPLPPLRVGAGCVCCDAGAFGPAGLRLSVESAQGRISGTLIFTDPTPPRCDIMGPFALMPAMECRHKLCSLRHRVDGELNFNGTRYRFESAAGYAEGDRGTSFPSRYLWTQSFFGAQSQNSVMLSVAEVPLGNLRFPGTIAGIWLDGKEYRLATYLGARVVWADRNGAKITQGSDSLEVRMLGGERRSLQAPVSGGMHRTVREGLCCRVFYRFVHHGQIKLQCICENASFEGEW